jgi:hypothetical protein
MRGNASFLLQKELFQEYYCRGTAVWRLVIVVKGFYSQDFHNKLTIHLFN